MRNFAVKKRFLLLACFGFALVFAWAGCSRQSASPAATTDSGTKTYPAHGVVQSVEPDLRHVRIKHDAIAGYMAAMTMDFPARDTNELKGLAAGDEINFTLAVTETDDWIESIYKVGQTNVAAAAGPPGW